MSKRNTIWLVVVVGIGIGIGASVGWLWGVLAALATLAVSELVERTRRQRLRQARGIEDAPSIKDAVVSRRRRR